MNRDIVPYDPYHPHLGYTLAITCLAWFSVNYYSRTFLRRYPRLRTGLYAFTIGLPLFTEALTYLIDVVRPAPDTPVGYVLTHLHANVIQRFPIDSFLSPTLGVVAAGLVMALLVVSLARYAYGSIELRRFLAGARPLAQTPYAGLLARLAGVTGASLGAIPPVFVKDAGVPLALTTGLLRPQIYITTGMCELLDEDEVLAVLCHEWAHVLRRDTLWSWMVRLLRDLGWFLPGTHLAWRHMVASQEEACDAMAASMMRQPLSLARALVKVGRALHGVEPRLSPAASLFALAGASPRERVEQMIDLSKHALPQGRSATLGAYTLGAGLQLLAILPALLGS